MTTPSDLKMDGQTHGATDEKPGVFATVATGAIEEGQVESLQGSANDVGPPPDGGLRAWLTVLGSFFAVFTQFGLGE